MSAWEAPPGQGFRAGVAGVLSDGFMCDDRRIYNVRESMTGEVCGIICTRPEVIKGGLVSEYGPGGAGFVERYGRDDVVDGFERGRRIWG